MQQCHTRKVTKYVDWVFDAQICILPHGETLFLSFLTPSSTVKLIKIEHYIVIAHLQKMCIVLIFMKKLCLSLFNLSRYSELGEARKFYDIRTEKQINCVTGNTLFQSRISVNVFKVKIYILKQVKKSSLHLFSYYKK